MCLHTITYQLCARGWKTLYVLIGVGVIVPYCTRSTQLNMVQHGASIVEDKNIKDLSFAIQKPPLKSDPKGKIAVIYVLRFAFAVRRVYFYKNVNNLLLIFVSVFVPL